DLECDRVGGFVAADLAALERLASEAARTMQRLWLLRHLRGKARQLESLITAGQSLVTKLQQHELFATLTRQARHMMQARACALYLHEKKTVQLAALAGEVERPTTTEPVPLESSFVASAVHTRRQVAFADIQSPDFRELADLPQDATLASVLAT